jgi:hypothetical protein
MGVDDAQRKLVAQAIALDAEGRLDEAVALLAPLINVTGHDEDAGLPCLCKHCLSKAGKEAEAQGMKFHRSFAVTGKRVLHFWMLAEQAGERAGVRASVTAALAARLEAVRGGRR